MVNSMVHFVTDPVLIVLSIVLEKGFVSVDNVCVFMNELDLTAPNQIHPVQTIARVTDSVPTAFVLVIRNMEVTNVKQHVLITAHRMAVATMVCAFVIVDGVGAIAVWNQHVQTIVTETVTVAMMRASALQDGVVMTAHLMEKINTHCHLFAHNSITAVVTDGVSEPTELRLWMNLNTVPSMLTK